MVYTSFQIRESSVRGYLVLVLSVVSLNRLVSEIEDWEQNQQESLKTGAEPEKSSLDI